MARRVVSAGTSSSAVNSVMRQADSFRKERERIENLSAEEQKNLAKDIPVDQLVPFPENEDVFGLDETQISVTADMIRSHGFWGAIWVAPYRDRYMIISGHQRWKAAIEAGQKTIPAFIYNIDQETAYRMWIDSNQLQRKSTPYAKFKLIESARKHIQERADAGDPNYTDINIYDKLVELTHIPKAGISRYERISKFPEFTRNCCRDENFPYTIVLPVAKFQDDQKYAFDTALKQYMAGCHNDPSPEMLRSLVRTFSIPDKARNTYSSLPDNEKALYDSARDRLARTYAKFTFGKQHESHDVDTNLENLAMHLNFFLDDSEAKITDPKRVTASIDMLNRCIRKLRSQNGVY